MTNLLDIPVVVSTLVTFFTMGASDAAIEALKGFAVNGALKLAELKDELLCKPEVGQAVQQYQQNPLDMSLKAQLEDVLTKAVEQHPAFQQQTAVQVQGDIKAEKGSVAAAVINGGTITLTNTFKD
jgi:hypothetical protein